MTQSNGDGNYAQVSQDTQNARSDILQQGNNNQSFVTQSAGANVSLSNIRQTGDANYASVAQSAATNDSFVFVDGNSNQAFVTQDGANNAQRVRVIGDFGSGNTDGVASNNVAITNQTATARDNWSSTAQQGDNNRAEITQSGVGERVSASRDYSDYRNNEPPEADVWQLSNDNRAYIDQASDASRVTIYQGLEQTPLTRPTTTIPSVATISPASGRTRRPTIRAPT